MGRNDRMETTDRVKVTGRRMTSRVETTDRVRATGRMGAIGREARRERLVGEWTRGN